MRINDFKWHSYVPYSNQPSLTVVSSKQNRYYIGTPVENISYPLHISAEQNALFCCLSEGNQPVELATTNGINELTPFWEKEFGVTTKKLDSNDFADHPAADVRLDSYIQPALILPDLVEQAKPNESHFPVAALVETEQGYFSGINIECTIWNMGLCAERVAIAKALAYGSKDLKSIHIHSRKGEFSSPCGACRQVIIEHMPNRQVYLHHADRSTSVHFSNDLLPYHFHSTDLKHKSN